MKTSTRFVNYSRYGNNNQNYGNNNQNSVFPIYAD